MGEMNAQRIVVTNAMVTTYSTGPVTELPKSIVFNNVTFRAVAIVLLLFGLAGQSTAKVRLFDKDIGWPGETLLGEPCYGRPQGTGPFDYADPRFATKGEYRHIIGHSGMSVRTLVEGAHFKPETERLERGVKSVSPMPDIDYTIRAFPNHHRALWAMVRYYLRQLKRNPNPVVLSGIRRGSSFPPPECYFYRAEAFNPHDPGVPAIFGLYLHKLEKFDAALAQYKKAESMGSPSSDLYYNMGLLYADMNDLENAQKYADIARKSGHPLTGLQRKIDRLKAKQKQSDLADQ